MSIANALPPSDPLSNVIEPYFITKESTKIIADYLSCTDEVVPRLFSTAYKVESNTIEAYLLFENIFRILKELSELSLFFYDSRNVFKYKKIQILNIKYNFALMIKETHRLVIPSVLETSIIIKDMNNSKQELLSTLKNPGEEELATFERRCRILALKDNLLETPDPFECPVSLDSSKSDTLHVASTSTNRYDRIKGTFRTNSSHVTVILWGQTPLEKFLPLKGPIKQN